MREILMENIYKRRPRVSPPLPWSNREDPTDLILSVIGRGLIIAFFIPVISIVPGSFKLLFINLRILGDNQAAGMLQFQALYPLLAGIAVIVLSRRDRSQVRAGALLGIALLPVLVLLKDNDVRMAFSELGRFTEGGFSVNLHLILSTLAVILMLASAHTLRIYSKHGRVESAAVIGGDLYLLSLLLPVNDEFIFFEPFKYLTFNDPSGAGVSFVRGVASLAALALMVTAAVYCLRIPKQDKSSDKEIIGIRVIRLWGYHLFVYGFAVYYGLFVNIFNEEPMSGALLLMFTVALVKFIPWILGLYVLIPLALAEFMLTVPVLSGIQTEKENKKDVTV
jgi:hypothetical protein